MASLPDKTTGASGLPEGDLHRTAVFSIRLQFFSAAALTLLVLFLTVIFAPTLPVYPLMALSVWVALYTLIISYIAVAGSPYWLEKGRLLRLGLFLNILTVTIATYLVREVSSDLYLLYFLPLITACIYFGLRGGLFTALMSGLAYYITAWLVGATVEPGVGYMILVRIVMFFLCAGALGVMAEGQVTLSERLREAYARLHEYEATIQTTKEQLGRKVSELSAVTQLSAAAVSTLNLEKVFSAVLGRAADLLQAETASLMLLNKNTGLLEIKAVVGLQDALVAVTGVRVGDGIAGWVAAEGKPLLLQGKVDDPRFAAAVPKNGVQSAICVPIKYQEEVMGVLSVSSRLPDRQFSDDDLRLLTTFADQTSLAIRNAQLYDQTMRELEQMRHLQQAKLDFIFTAMREISASLERVHSQVDSLIRTEQIAPTPGQELVQTLAAESQRVTGIMDNLLGVSAQDVRLLRLKVRPLEIQSLLEVVTEEFKPRLTRHSIVIDIPTGLSSVMGDMRSLAEVVRILINNVVQLAPLGGVIRIQGEQDPQYVHINIGSGQQRGAPEKLDDFFAHFYDSSKALDMERLGLNLFTAKGLVEACGGKLQVSGGLGEDSVFRFTLPKA